MSEVIPALDAENREKLGSRYTRRLREAGKIPAVVYGHGEEPAHIVFDAKLFNEAVHSGSHVLDVTVNGKTEHCLLKSVQWDYLGRSIIHVDLTRVDLSEKVESVVDIELAGDPKAAHAGGAGLEHPIVQVTILCAASKIPDKLVVDISKLTLETPIHVSDLVLPEGAEMISDGNGVVAHIVMSKVVEEEETDGAEPEVIEKGKKEEE